MHDLLIAFATRIVRPVKGLRRAAPGALLACGLTSFVSFASFAAADPLVIVVRHAEHSGQPAGDPSLSLLGEARANALANALADIGVTAIVTTQHARTRDTAAPIAALANVAPEIVPAERGKLAEHVVAIVAAVRRHREGVVLVIGHSNTVNKIIGALGGPVIPDLCEASHGELFVLTANDSAKNATKGSDEKDGARVMRLLRVRYGAAEPPLDANCKPAKP
jgi:phosphohistidine phosphatase SixA